MKGTKVEAHYNRCPICVGPTGPASTSLPFEACFNPQCRWSKFESCKTCGTVLGLEWQPSGYYKCTSCHTAVPWVSEINNDVVNSTRVGGQLDKCADIASHIRDILQCVGEDPNRDGLKETPTRVAKMYLNELMSGYAQDPDEVFKTFESDGFDEMVIVKDIPLYSLCEHHMTPFIGKVHVGYLPNKRVVGISKVVRLVEVFARRLQIQERLTMQIADSMMKGLDPRGVHVVVAAQHLCMSQRGVRSPGALTITSAVRGVFRDVPAAREEFLTLIGMCK